MPEIDLSSVKLPELDSAALLSKLTEAAAPLVKALSSAGIDLSSIDEKALTSSATELANSATGLASGAAIGFYSGMQTDYLDDVRLLMRRSAETMATRSLWSNDLDRKSVV